MHTHSGRLVVGGSMVALILFLFLFVMDTSGPYQAWADVFENARQATSCRFRARDRDRRDTEAVKIYSDLGFAQETYEGAVDVAFKGNRPAVFSESGHSQIGPMPYHVR